MKWQGGFWKYLGSRRFLSYVPSGCRRVDVVGGVVHGQAFFPRCMLLVSQCVLHFHSTCLALTISTTHARANMVDLGFRAKCPKVFPSQPLQTQICTYKMVHLLKRWFLYRMASWFSLSMTNSHFLKPPNHTLKNIYKMAFCLLQNGLSWCPKMIMPSKQKW